MGDGANVMGFKVFDVSRQEDASIAEECKLIEIFDMYEFRNAADRALRGVAKRLVCLVYPPFSCCIYHPAQTTPCFAAHGLACSSS